MCLLLKELELDRVGRGSTPFDPERDEFREELVEVDRTEPWNETMLPGPDASLCRTSDVMLLVSLLEAGEPLLRL